MFQDPALNGYEQQLLQANQSLRCWLEAAVPAWSAFGGAKRLLTVVPSGSAGKRFRGLIGDDLAGKMTFAFDFNGTQVIADDPFIDGDGATGSRWTYVPVSFSS